MNEDKDIELSRKICKEFVNEVHEYIQKKSLEKFETSLELFASFERLSWVFATQALSVCLAENTKTTSEALKKRFCKVIDDYLIEIDQKKD
jgi:hypothetical protein